LQELRPFVEGRGETQVFAQSSNSLGGGNLAYGTRSNGALLRPLSYGESLQQKTGHTVRVL